MSCKHGKCLSYSRRLKRLSMILSWLPYSNSKLVTNSPPLHVIAPFIVTYDCIWPFAGGKNRKFCRNALVDYTNSHLLCHKGDIFLYDNLQQKLNKTDFCKRQIWSSQSQQIWIQNMLGMLNPISCITWHVTTQRKTFKLLFISLYYERNTMYDGCFSWTFNLTYVQLVIIIFG